MIFDFAFLACAAKICKSADEPYTLSGCHKIETCQEPQALGYELTLGSKSPCADR